jgi:hypothetical protein
MKPRQPFPHHIALRISSDMLKSLLAYSQSHLHENLSFTIRHLLGKQLTGPLAKSGK